MDEVYNHSFWCGQRCNIESRCCKNDGRHHFSFKIYTADWEEKTSIPARYVTHCALSVNGNTQVLLAMSKLDGVPLDQWPLGSCWLIWEYGDGHHGHMLS